MMDDTSGVSVYITAWGSFQMPAGLAERTRWRYFDTGFLRGKQVVREPEPTPDNHEFFSWLHAEEVKAGKPE